MNMLQSERIFVPLHHGSKRTRQNNLRDIGTKSANSPSLIVAIGNTEVYTLSRDIT